MSWWHRGFTWKPQSSLTPVKLASGFCKPEPLPVDTGIKGRQVHPLIRFLLWSRVAEKCADLHKAFHLCFVPGWRHGAVSGVPLSSDSPGHFNWKSTDLRVTVRASPPVRPHGPLTPHTANVPPDSWVISLVCSTGRPAFHSVRHPRIGCRSQHQGMGPLRMKVWRGCPPRVLSPPKHLTQSWWPCLPWQPRVSGWRSTDRPVPSPRIWMIGFSEQGTAHNRVLLQYLFSRRCKRSWRRHGWPLSQPEAARLSLLSSLPRWIEWSRCTCAYETLPLGGIVRISWPKPVSWRPLSWPKLIVLRARQPLPG